MMTSLLPLAALVGALPIFSRRAALFGLFAAPGAAAAASQDAKLHLEEPQLQHGHMLFQLGDRTVEVNTLDTPHLRIEVESAGYGDRTVEVLYSEPEPGAEYLVVSWDGRLLVTPLQAGSTVTPMAIQRQRFGYVGGAEGTHRIAWAVSVLGKVVSDGAAATADPMIEAASYRASIEARVSRRGNGLTEDEVAELLDDVDERLLASVPTTYQGALSALDVLSDEMAAFYDQPTWRTLLDGALKVLRAA